MPKRVLIVEDEVAIREMVGFALRRAEFEMEEAANGAEARARIFERRPDLLLLDWMLLETGADDYITKPFSPRELIARIRAVLRRASPDDDERLEIGGLCLDSASHRVTAHGEQVDLGPTEYRLLQFLMRHADRVFSRSQLIERVWGGGVYIEERTVDVHVRRLRKVLEPHRCDGLIQTVRGAGYRFSADSKKREAGNGRR